MNAIRENRGESLDGAFRVAREQETDALLQILLANQPAEDRRSAAELRNHAHGVILGLQELLVNERFYDGFAEELGRVLCGLTTGTEDVLIEIATHLDGNLRACVPPFLREELRIPITRLVVQVMAGWIARKQQTQAQRQEQARVAHDLAVASSGEDILREVIAQSPIALKVAHLESGAPVVHNPAMEQLFGFTLEEEMLLPPEMLKNEDSADDDFDLLSDMIAGRIPKVERISARPHKDGHSVPFRMLGWPIRDAAGNVTHIADAFFPADRRAPETEGAGLSESRARYLVHLSPDPVAIANAEGIIRYVSPSVESTFGYDDDEVLGQFFGFFLVDSSRAAGERLLEACRAVPRARILAELEVRLKDGSTRWHEIVATNLLDVPAVQGVVLQGRDITERRALQHELERSARTDGLTGLLNRRGFVECLREILAAGEDASISGLPILLVCYVDLDRFKQINDCFGHAAGDAVLAKVGVALGSLGAGDAVAGRMGGDEFVIHAKFDDRTDVERFLQQLSAALHGTISMDGRKITYSGTYGAVAVERRAGLDADRLISRADQELGRAKSSGVRGKFDLGELGDCIMMKV